MIGAVLGAGISNSPRSRPDIELLDRDRFRSGVV